MTNRSETDRDGRQDPLWQIVMEDRNYGRQDYGRQDIMEDRKTILSLRDLS